MIKFLFLTFFVCSSYAGQNTEFFDQAQNGKFKIDFSILHKNSQLGLVSVNNPGVTLDKQTSESLFKLDYGYGLSEDMALHLKLGYLIGKETEDVSNDANSETETKIKGLSDLALRLSGNHDTQNGIFNWNFNLDYGLGDNTLKYTQAGPPNIYESNSYSGRTKLNLQLGYVFKIDYGYLGLSASGDIIQNDADIIYTDLSGTNFEMIGDGGTSYAWQMFYELHGDKILWGLSLGYLQRHTTEIILDGTTVDYVLDTNSYRFNVYSRLVTGPGQELFAGFGYDVYEKSGGLPANYKIDEGSGFLVSVAYAISY